MSLLRCCWKGSGSSATKSPTDSRSDRDSILLLPSQDELAKTKRKADHPLSGKRVRTLGTQILNHPEHYYTRGKPSDPQIPALLKEIGSGLVELGSRIDELSKDDLRRVALITTIDELKTCKSDSNTSQVH